VRLPQIITVIVRQSFQDMGSRPVGNIQRRACLLLRGGRQSGEVHVAGRVRQIGGEVVEIGGAGVTPDAPRSAEFNDRMIVGVDIGIGRKAAYFLFPQHEAPQQGYRGIEVIQPQIRVDLRPAQPLLQTRVIEQP